MPCRGVTAAGLARTSSMLRATALAVLVCVLCAGEAVEAAAKLPPAAQAVLDRLAKVEARIDADAARQRSGERQKAIKELEKAQQTATRSGDLDAAVAVKARIDAMKQDEAAAADALLGDERASAKDPAKLAVGSWTLTKTNGIAGQIELTAEKTARASVGAFVVSGIWQLEKDRVVIHWGGDPTKWENVAFETPDRLTGDTYDAGRGGVTLVRVRK